jgi:membrane-bound serine protease (ClpP class)
MNELTLIVILFLCGLLAVGVEMFIPGVIIGTIGLLTITASIVYAIAKGHTVVGVVLIVVSLLLAPVLFALWKGVLGRFFASEGHERGFRPSVTVRGDLVGQEGEAVSPLRPSGIAYLGDKRCDVVTRGEMVESGARIKVIEVSGNRIVVKQV